jgi:hypothetical protein
MASVKEAMYEADGLFSQGFREIIIAFENSGKFLFIEYNSSGFSTQEGIKSVMRGGYTLAAVFGWGHDRNHVPVLRFRAVPGFRTLEHQTNIVFEFRYQQCVAEVLKKEEENEH